MKYDSEVTVGEGASAKTYVLQKFTATTAVKLFTKLVKLLGIPASQAWTGMDKEANDLIPKVIGSLTERLDEDEVLLLMKDLLRCASHQQVPVVNVFDAHFQGDMLGLFALLKEILTFQYGDFFGALVDATKGQAAKGKSKSQTTSRG